MKTYILDTFNRYKRYSEKLDAKTILCNKSWWVFNDLGEKETYIFQEDGSLIISLSGKVTDGTWKYLPVNKSVIISGNNQSYMVLPSFVDGNILALQIDGTHEYAFLIDENNKSNFQPNTYTEVVQYFENKEKKAIEAQLQAEQEKKRRLEDKQKQIEDKKRKQEEELAYEAISYKEREKEHKEIKKQIEYKITYKKLNFIIRVITAIFIISIVVMFLRFNLNTFLIIILFILFFANLSIFIFADGVAWDYVNKLSDRVYDKLQEEKWEQGKKLTQEDILQEEIKKQVKYKIKYEKLNFIIRVISAIFTVFPLVMLYRIELNNYCALIILSILFIINGNIFFFASDIARNYVDKLSKQVYDKKHTK